MRSGMHTATVIRNSKEKLQLREAALFTARVIYDRVRNSKNYFEIPTFLPIE